MSLRWGVLAGLTALLACNETNAPLETPDSGGGVADALPMVGDQCEQSDHDGDGYGTDPSCSVIDCDDTNLGVHPGAVEACNGIDEDCDDEIDEELGEGFCGLGACKRAVPFCQGGRPVGCTPGEAIAESCNGLDDDCDGDTDEDLSGETCGVGACVAAATCTNGTFNACTPGAPTTESCNGADDDCNGTVDEGFRATSIQTSYTVMRSLHAPCDGGGERIGPNCNAAVHRFCATNGCTTTGFGPLENSGDTFFAGCVRADGFDVPYAELATHHATCDGTAERIGPNCNAAMHRYCASRGYATGFGPAEQSTPSALVQCVPNGVAAVVNTSYTVLATHHDGCTTGTRIGPACNAAINRFCNSQGHVTGFGPIENSGDTAVVACVDP